MKDRNRKKIEGRYERRRIEKMERMRRKKVII